MDELCEPLKHLFVRALVDLVPVQLGALEGLTLLGIGDEIGVPSEGGELAAATLGDGLCHRVLFMVREVLEGRGGSVLLTLKDERDEWSGEDKAGGDLRTVEADDLLEAIAGGAIADLIVVLDEADKVMHGEAVHRASVPAVAILRERAVVDEDAGERLGKIFEGAEVVVVALALLDVQDGEERVVEVVAPLRVHAVSAGFAWGYNAGIVEVALGDEHEAASEDGRQDLDLGGELLHEVNGGSIDELMHGIEAQTVDVVVAHPHQRVVAEETAHLVAARLLKINCVAPRRVMSAIEVGTEPAGGAAYRSEVGVEDVDEDRNALLMAGVDEALQTVGTAVPFLHCE